MGLSIVSEPPNGVVDSNRWFSSSDRSAAILWNLENSGHICRLIRRGNGFVVVRIGEINVISCYISPNVLISRFEDFLADINNCVRSVSGLFIIGGDFNAKSAFWGSSVTDRRGALGTCNVSNCTIRQ